MELPVPGIGNGLEKLCGLFLLHLVQLEEVLQGEVVEGRHVPQIPLFKELFHGLFTEAIDIHGVSSGIMDDALDELRFAGQGISQKR